MQTFFNLNTILAYIPLIVSTALARSSPANITTSTNDPGTHKHESRDQIATLTFDGGVTFPGCLPFHDNRVCTVAFVDNSGSGGHAQLFAYDNTCQPKGDDSSVSRDILAAYPLGYAMISGLPETLWVYVSKDWDATDKHAKPAVDGVLLKYKEGPEVAALHSNLHGLATWTGLNTAEGIYWTFWRAPFLCGV